MSGLVETTPPDDAEEAQVIYNGDTSPRPVQKKATTSKQLGYPLRAVTILMCHACIKAYRASENKILDGFLVSSFKLCSKCQTANYTARFLR